MAAFSLLQWLLLLLVRDDDHTGCEFCRWPKAQQYADHFDVDTSAQGTGIQHIAGTVVNTRQVVAVDCDRIDSA